MTEAWRFGLKRCSSGASVTKSNKEITQNLLKGLKQFVWEVDW